MFFVPTGNRKYLNIETETIAKIMCIWKWHTIGHIRWMSNVLVGILYVKSFVFWMTIIENRTNSVGNQCVSECSCACACMWLCVLFKCSYKLFQLFNTNYWISTQSDFVEDLPKTLCQAKQSLLCALKLQNVLDFFFIQLP